MLLEPALGAPVAPREENARRPAVAPDDRSWPNALGDNGTEGRRIPPRVVAAPGPPVAADGTADGLLASSRHSRDGSRVRVVGVAGVVTDRF